MKKLFLSSQYLKLSSPRNEAWWLGWSLVFGLFLGLDSVQGQVPKLQSGLAAYYPLNGDGMDYGPFGFDGVVSGALEGESVFDGNSGALWFDGVNDSVLVPAIGLGAPISELSVTFWMQVRERTSGYADHVISKGDSGNINDYALAMYFFGAGAGALSGMVRPFGSVEGTWVALDNGDEDFGNFFIPVEGVWHHYGFSYDGGKAEFYVDGVLRTTKAMTGNLTSNNQPLRMGGGWGAEYFNGALDEVYFFRRGLEAEEISFLGSPFKRWLENQKVAVGGRLEVDPEVEGSGWEYQWFFNEIAMNGETQPALVVESARLSDEGSYRLQVEKGGKRYLSHSFFISVASVESVRLEVSGAVCLEWESEEGEWYQLQVSNELEVWEDLGEPLEGSGQVIRLFEKSDPTAPRFYRLKPLTTQ